MTLRLLLAAAVSFAQLASPAETKHPSTILSDDVQTVHAERMNYPIGGRVHHQAGAVVVLVDVDESGLVRSASAISGPRALIPETIENAKKWRFSRTARGSAVIVYLFQFKGICEQGCPANFEFYPPNIAIVSIGDLLAMP